MDPSIASEGIQDSDVIELVWRKRRAFETALA